MYKQKGKNIYAKLEVNNVIIYMVFSRFLKIFYIMV